MRSPVRSHTWYRDHPTCNEPRAILLRTGVADSVHICATEEKSTVLGNLYEFNGAETRTIASALFDAKQLSKLQFNNVITSREELVHAGHTVRIMRRDAVWMLDLPPTESEYQERLSTMIRGGIRNARNKINRDFGEAAQFRLVQGNTLGSGRQSRS